MNVDLNSDLGEGVGNDAELMSLVTSANICCGAHAGDEATARTALTLAKAAGVVVGAHPGYADRECFGRRERELSDAELWDLIARQIDDLRRWAREAGVAVRYLKPHGALYNQACRDERIAGVVVAVAEANGLPILALPGSRLEALCQGRAPFFREGFADRRYRADGSLVPRSEADAMLTDVSEALAQAERLIRDCDVCSLCVHGDHPEAVAFVRELRRALTATNIPLRPFIESLR